MDLLECPAAAAPALRPASATPHPAVADRLAPVLMLHSSGASSRQWRALAGELGRGRAVHAEDFHGHGGRAAWQGPSPMRIADEAAPAIAALERLGGAHVVGHSYGGAVAFHIACHRPELVRSLVAYEPVLPRLLAGDREGDPLWRASGTLHRAAATGAHDQAAQSFVDFWSGAGTWSTLSPAQQAGVAACVPQLLHQFEALYASSPEARDLVGLGTPVFVLHGDATVPIARRIVNRLAALLPRARIEPLAADRTGGDVRQPEVVGHLGPITHAAPFNRRVTAWLAERDFA